MQLTPAEQNRLDAFQVKCFRRVIGLPPTFIDRSYPNEHVYQMTSLIMGKDIFKKSQSWQTAKFKLLGHIIRAVPEDSMRQVVFQQNTFEPSSTNEVRAGRPKQS